ncbi:MAG: diguanylate cyclase [Myxococcales bacterium]|nr:diguanylate cyclase [Myxococcales bacterium]
MSAEASDARANDPDADPGGPRACVVTLLRAVAKYAIDVGDLASDEVKGRYIAWADRVEGEANADAVDWSGLANFLVEARKREQQKVNQNVHELRATMSFLIASVQQSIVEDGVQDGGVADRLSDLERALEGASIDDIRKAAATIVSATNAAIESRRERHAKQLQAVRNPRARRAVFARDADPLSSLLEREAFDNELICKARFSPNQSRAMCVLLIEATAVDQMGRPMSQVPPDEVLRPVADRCRRIFQRLSDVVARIGDTSIAVIADVDHEDTAFRLAQRLLLWIREITTTHEGKELAFAVNMSLAALRAGEPADSWIGRAQGALADSKSEGRNRLIVADYD